MSVYSDESIHNWKASAPAFIATKPPNFLEIFWHGKAINDNIDVAAKASAREQVKHYAKRSIMVQSFVDFATVASKLLRNVKIIHIHVALKFNSLL